VIHAREAVGAKRLEQMVLGERAEIDVVLDGRDPGLGLVLGAVPGLFLDLGLQHRAIGLLDLHHGAAEGEPLERARLLELRLGVRDARLLRQQIQVPAHADQRRVPEVVERVGDPSGRHGDGAGRVAEVCPQPQPDVGEELGALVIDHVRARDDAGAGHVDLRPEEAGRLQVRRDGREGTIGTLERLVGDLEGGLDAGEEAQRGHGVKLGLHDLAGARDHLLAEHLEPEAIPLGDALVVRLELLLDAVDALVEARDGLVDDVLRVAGHLDAEVRAPAVHADLLAELLHVPFADAHPGLGRVADGGDLPERVERDGSVDAELEEGLDGGELRLRALRDGRRSVEQRAAQRREHAGSDVGAPLEEGRPLRLVELGAHGGQTRAGGPHAGVVAIGEGEDLGERISARLDGGDRRLVGAEAFVFFGLRLIGRESGRGRQEGKEQEGTAKHCGPRP
jgi:hypothetical protein